ncbi:MAG: sigma-70 family RNA polymerase sigma factor [Planctomycetota bacterium]
MTEGDGDDAEVLSTWVDEHADYLYRFACSKVDDSNVVDDLLQETYLAAVRGRSGFRAEASVRSWLVAILRLKIIDHYRAKAKHKRVTSIDSEETPFREDRLEAWDVSVSQPLENAEFWSVMHACVDKLPTTLSKAYFMREMEDCPPEQVCDTLSITAKNLAVRLFRARALLRDCLDRNWFSSNREPR